MGSRAAGELVVEAVQAEAGNAHSREITPENSPLCELALARVGFEAGRLVMKPEDFLRGIDRAKVVSAIRAAERQTNGQIRVVVSRHRPTDTMRSARQAFARLKMTRTSRRNSVLIFLAPGTQSHAIVGDISVQEKCGDDFWQEVVEVMAIHLRKGEFTVAILTGVEKVGALLGEHFPRQPGDSNELPDDIVEE